MAYFAGNIYECTLQAQKICIIYLINENNGTINDAP